MGAWEAVDAYCERTGPEFWAEPVNALTNLAFLVAALAMLGPALRARDAGALVLVAILGAIGIGSFLFHTLAVRWAGLADVLPILAFILAYVWLASRRFLGLSRFAALLPLAAFLPVSAAIAWAMPRLIGPVGGSEGYLGTLAYLAAYAVILLPASPATGGRLLAAALLLALSLTARSLDGALCDRVPLGTHFLWHLLNALLLGRVIAAMLAHAPRVAGRAGRS
jgi:hypothetical protein